MRAKFINESEKKLGPREFGEKFCMNLIQSYMSYLLEYNPEYVDLGDRNYPLEDIGYSDDEMFEKWDYISLDVDFLEKYSNGLSMLICKYSDDEEIGVKFYSDTVSFDGQKLDDEYINYMDPIPLSAMDDAKFDEILEQMYEHYVPKNMNENEGIPWSGKDPTKAPVIGKLLTRRTKLGDGETMKPEILQVVEVNEPYYVINKWYKSGVPQIIHDDMVAHYIPIEKYKDTSLEGKTVSEELQAFNEAVSRAEDEWANREIEKNQNKDKEFSKVGYPKAPEGQEETPENILNLANQVSSLEEFLWNMGDEADRTKWRNYVLDNLGQDYQQWTDLTEEELEKAYHEARSIVNFINRRN